MEDGVINITLLFEKKVRSSNHIRNLQEFLTERKTFLKNKHYIIEDMIITEYNRLYLEPNLILTN